MKKILLLFFFNFAVSQNNYIVEYDFNLVNHYQQNYSLKSKLIIQNDFVIFKWGDNNKEEINTTDSEGNALTFTGRDSIGTINFFDVNIKSLYTRFQDFGQVFVTNESCDMKWEILNENKKILNFICYKAITEFRGRKYTAWFTKKINNSFGPWKFNNLHGLILEVYDDNYKLHITATKMNKNNVKKNLVFDINGLINKSIELKKYINAVRKHLETHNIKDNNDYIEKAYEWDN